MLLVVIARGEAEFRCKLIVNRSTGSVEQIKEFPQCYIPVRFGSTWIPDDYPSDFDYCEDLPTEGAQSDPDVRLKMRIGPVTSLDAFFLVRCVVTHPNFVLNLIRNAQCAPRRLKLAVSTHNNFSTHICWYRRLLKLKNEFIHCSELFSWLSTLGGAYSAMGEYGAEYANVAKNISVKQMQLAMRTGDPSQVCRCWVFLALSAIQHGHLKLCRAILLEQWKFANSMEGLRDPRLRNMVIGSWEKLREVRTARKTLPKPSSTNGMFDVRVSW